MSKKATNFGQKLKAYLDAGSIQQKTLADMTGLSVQALIDIKSGSGDPKESTMRSIAEALGYTLAEFISDKENTVHTIDDCYAALGKFIKTHARK